MPLVSSPFGFMSFTCIRNTSVFAFLNSVVLLVLEKASPAKLSCQIILPNSFSCRFLLPVYPAYRCFFRIIFPANFSCLNLLPKLNFSHTSGVRARSPSFLLSVSVLLFLLQISPVKISSQIIPSDCPAKNPLISA